MSEENITTTATVTKNTWDCDNEDWEIYPRLDITKVKGISKYNVRQETPDIELDEIVVSLRETGINTRPITLDEDWEVIEGGRRYQALMKAELKEVFAIRKAMTPKEKLIRSFAENELQYKISDKDRYDFAMKLRTDHNLSVEEIARAVGRSTSTVSRWLQFKSIPETIKDTPGEVAFRETSDRKRTPLREVLDSQSLKENPTVAVKLAVDAKDMTLTGIETIKKEYSSGGMKAYPAEIVESIRTIDEEYRQHPERFELVTTRFYKELYNTMNAIRKVAYPKKTINDIIIEVVDEWAKAKKKEVGLMG